MNHDSICLKTDSYKASHYLQYPPEMTASFFYGGTRTPEPVMFFGLQSIIEKHLKCPSRDDVKLADEIWKAHGLPFNKEGWMYVSELGYLPLKIRAVPEGMVVPGGGALFTAQSTDINLVWLPSWVETLLMQVWYPTTAATLSMQCKKAIKKYMTKSCDSLDGLPFKLHDFGYRGATSNESAGIYGAAHLLNFMGTDTMAGIRHAMKYYGAGVEGFSIPAAEHSTVISWNKSREDQAYENMIDQFGGSGKIFAVVSDSYDINNAIKSIWGGTLKDRVMTNGGTLVVRPDSGDPAEMVVRVLKMIEEIFGSTSNSKGYKVLPPYIRVIQGDGIDGYGSVEYICSEITESGFSMDNVAFGMGGGLSQRYDRDTLKFAMKMSAMHNGSVWVGVQKKPIDAPWKASRYGILDVDVNLETYNMLEDQRESVMETVFHNGSMSKSNFSKIKERANVV